MAWPTAAEPALDGPMAGLAFGADVEAVWAAAPGLREALALSLDPAAFDAFAARHPEAAAPPRISSGGNRFGEHKSRSTAWPELEGGRWSVEVDGLRGLHRVRIEYRTDVSAKLVAAWGPPDHTGRWQVWTNGGVRAAWTGCYGEECTLELMPYRPASEVVRDTLRPHGATPIGAPRATFPAGRPMGDGLTQLPASPTECSSGYLPWQLAERDGVVVGARAQFDWTYCPAFEPILHAALDAALGPPTHQPDGCRTWPGGERACDQSSTVLVTLGDVSGF